MKESLKRLIGLFGEDNLLKLQQKTVAIVGLGGVGGTIALSLARSGIQNFIICDFDTIEESNINRQVITNYENLGQLKTDVLYDEIKKINPESNIIKIPKKVDEELFNYNIDIVVDAIDDVKSKEYLITECVSKGIKVISSMGAGNKIDPTKVEITKLSKTTYDPLAKVLRHDLKGIEIDVCSSVEESVKSELIFSYINVVSMFSLLISDYVIKYLIREV